MSRGAGRVQSPMQTDTNDVPPPSENDEIHVPKRVCRGRALVRKRQGPPDKKQHGFDNICSSHPAPARFHVSDEGDVKRGASSYVSAQSRAVPKAANRPCRKRKAPNQGDAARSAIARMREARANPL